MSWRAPAPLHCPAFACYGAAARGTPAAARSSRAAATTLRCCALALARASRRAPAALQLRALEELREKREALSATMAREVRAALSRSRSWRLVRVRLSVGARLARAAPAARSAPASPALAAQEEERRTIQSDLAVLNKRCGARSHPQGRARGTPAAASSCPPVPDAPAPSLRAPLRLRPPFRCRVARDAPTTWAQPPRLARLPTEHLYLSPRAAPSSAGSRC